MEIPKSMQSVWAEVSKDNKITKQEYSQLLEVAAPNKKNEEFDNEEVEFLGGIKQQIDTKGFVEGNITDEYKSQNSVKPQNSPSSSSSDKSFEFLGNVGNAHNSWSKKHPNKPFPKAQIFYVTKDGNLISQSKLNETIKKDPNYTQTLNLKGAKTLFIPDLKSVDADNFKLQNNKIVNKNQEVTQHSPYDPVPFVDENEETPSNDSARQVEKANTPTKDTNTGNNLPPVPEKLKAKWEELSKDGEITPDDYQNLLHTVAPKGEVFNLKRDEVNFLLAIKRKVVEGNGSFKIHSKTETPVIHQSTKFNPSEAPETIKETWKKVSADGKITKADYRELIKAIAPNGKDEEVDESEFKFLTAIKEQLSGKESIDVEPYGSVVKPQDNKLKEKANQIIRKYATSFIPNPTNAQNRTNTEKAIVEDVSKMSSEDLSDLKNQLSSIPDDRRDGGGDNGAKHAILSSVNSEISKRDSEKPTAQALINKYSDSFQVFRVNKPAETKAKAEMQSAVGNLSDKDLVELKNQIKYVSYGRSNVGVYHTLKAVIDDEIKKRNLNTAPQPTPTQPDNKTKVPSTLETIWNEVSKDRVLDVNDFKALIKVAKPNGKDEELDAEEHKFLSDLTSKMIQADGTLAL